MRPVAILFGLTIALSTSACGGPDDKSVRDELRRQSTASGLALLEVGTDHPVVIPFDAPITHLKLPRSQGVAYAVGTLGSMIAWYRAISLTDILAATHLQDPVASLQSELLIQTTDGKTVVRRRFLVDIMPIALSERTHRLAFVGSLPPEYPRPGTYWRSFDFSTGGFIGDGAAVHAEWSPDGATLAYEEGEEIRLFDIASGSSKTLAKGVSPSWSPDGKRIAFQSPDWLAALITPEGKRMDWPIGRHHISGRVGWSPDGRFVSVPDIGSITWLLAYSRPLVCRVADGACMSQDEVPDRSAWIVDYRSLCRAFAATDRPQ